MIEMTALSNGINLPLDKIGMNGPISEVKDLNKKLIPEEDGEHSVVLEELTLCLTLRQVFFYYSDSPTVIEEMEYLQWRRATTHFIDHII